VKQLILPFLFTVVLAGSATAQRTIFIVRHAEKAQTGADDKDPGLSDAGRARAERLASILKGANISAIFATEFKRTQATAAPLAGERRLQVTTVKASDSAALLAALQKAPGNVLVVGHSNTIPTLVRALGVTVPVEIAETDYDHLFAVVLAQEPHLIHSRY